jgi:hypothetical protein
MASNMIVLVTGLAVVVFGAAVWAFRPPDPAAENQIEFMGLKLKMNTPALAVMALGIVLVLASTMLTETTAKSYRTSFNCRLAQGTVEEWICGDEQLAGLDLINADLFKAVRDKLPTGQIKEFEAVKDRFVGERRICKTKDCVEQSFLQRIEILRDQLKALNAS